MKLWPQKRWKQILLVIFLIIVVVFASVFVYIGLTLNKDVISEIEIFNDTGSKSALIVYQPGLSSFPRDIAYAFGNGLSSVGWKVEINTASSESPSDLSNYSLLVLGFPTYGGEPGTAIVRYIDRLSNLNEVNTALLVCAAGSPGQSLDIMKQKVQVAGGIFKESFSFFTMAPNEGNGTTNDIAKQAGAQIQP